MSVDKTLQYGIIFYMEGRLGRYGEKRSPAPLFWTGVALLAAGATIWPKDPLIPLTFQLAGIPGSYAIMGAGGASMVTAVVLRARR